MLTQEPLWTVAGITALVSAVISAAVAFGLNLSEEQIAAILGLVAVAAPLVVAALARGRVTPTDRP